MGTTLKSWNLFDKPTIFVRYYWSSWPEVLCKKVAFKNFLQITRKHVCLSVLSVLRQAYTFIKKDPSTGAFPWIFWDFLERLVCITHERLLLALVRICLVWPTIYLSMFCIVDCKSVVKVLRWRFLLIWHWWASNQLTNVENAREMITEVCLDIQTVERGNTVI